jgi:hypothetical protein
MRARVPGGTERGVIHETHVVLRNGVGRSEADISNDACSVIEDVVANLRPIILADEGRHLTTTYGRPRVAEHQGAASVPTQQVRLARPQLSPVSRHRVGDSSRGGPEFDLAV